MRTRWIPTIVALAAFAGGVAPALAQQGGWLTDYAAAKAEARKTGKPLMIVFR